VTAEGFRHCTANIMFEVLDVSLQVVNSLRPALELLRQGDVELHDQVRRAASSMCLNLAEGNKRTGRDRLQFFRIAAGSAEELRTAIQVAHAWGILDPKSVEHPLELLDRVVAMLWRLTHPDHRQS